MSNLSEIKKEILRQRKKRVSKKKEWNELESRKKTENEIAVHNLINSGMRRRTARELIKQEALFDKQFFNALAYHHIKSKDKKKVQLLKSLTNKQN
jgi:hypothetical protein